MPAKVRALEYMQEKVVFDNKNSQSMMAAAPPLLGSLSSTGLIAHIITSKYVDGLPLYLIEKKLRRYGGELSRETLAKYVMKSYRMYLPLVN
ncbi:hypothetical protein B6A42_11065 [Vibrio coralliilyticus]|nr:hypothetical protein B6A42_11065 [Vibrio coralliilyticus]